MNTINIFVVGKTGVGKSTLVNAILKNDIAKTGKGKPVTAKCETYSTEYELSVDNFPEMWSIRITDTVGFEIGRMKDAIEALKQEIRRQLSSAETSEMFAIWLCVFEGCHRIENEELQQVKTLSRAFAIPYYLVITQNITESNTTLMDYIANACPGIPVYSVLSQDKQLATGTIPAFGVDIAIKNTIRDNLQRTTAIKLEKVISQKTKRVGRLREEGEKCIQTHMKAVGMRKTPHSVSKTLKAELTKLAGFKLMEEPTYRPSHLVLNKEKAKAEIRIYGDECISILEQRINSIYDRRIDQLREGITHEMKGENKNGRGSL